MPILQHSEDTKKIVNHFLCFYYLLFSVLGAAAVYLSLDEGVLGGDFFGFGETVERSVLIETYFMSFLFDLFLIAVFFCVSHLPSIFKNKKFNIQTRAFGGGGLMVVMFFLLVAMLTTRVGTVFREEESNRLVDLAFAISQPLYLAIIHLYANISNRTRSYSVIHALLVLCSVVSGFTGFLLYLAPIWFFYLVRLVRAWIVVLFLILGVLSLPVLRFAKFLYINGMDAIEIDAGPLDVLFRYYEIFLPIVLDRFTNVYNVIYIERNSQYFIDIISGSANPIFQGYLGSFFHKIIFGVPVENINLYLYQSFAGYSSGESNSTFPIVSYFIISLPFGFFILAFYSIVCYVFINIMRTYADNQFAFFLAFIAFYTLVVGGWFWPYMNFVQASVVYFFIKMFHRGPKTICA